ANRADELKPILSLQRSSAGLQLSWPGTIQRADHTTLRPYFELQHSSSLLDWQPVGERVRAPQTVTDSVLSLTVTANEAFEFYRLLQIEYSGPSALGTGGAEVFGYRAA